MGNLGASVAYATNLSFQSTLFAIRYGPMCLHQPASLGSMMLEIQYFKAATTNIGAMTMRWMTMSFHFTSISFGTDT